LTWINFIKKQLGIVDGKAVLMVCTANICRSPMAEGILRHKLTVGGREGTIKVDSAGIHVFQTGHQADHRAREISLDRGVDLSKSRARQFEKKDFSRYDYILAMDKNNLQALRDICPSEHLEKLFMVMDFAPEYGITEVPDPYFSSIAGFEAVFDMLDIATAEFLQQIQD
jgi:low molecular weight protein-tyrosine phosphatase